MGGGWLVFDNAQVLWQAPFCMASAQQLAARQGRVAAAKLVPRTLKE